MFRNETYYPKKILKIIKACFLLLHLSLFRLSKVSLKRPWPGEVPNHCDGFPANCAVVVIKVAAHCLRAKALSLNLRILTLLNASFSIKLVNCFLNSVLNLVHVFRFSSLSAETTCFHSCDTGSCKMGNYEARVYSNLQKQFSKVVSLCTQ